MFCIKCGGKVLPGSEFCHRCGAELLDPSILKKRPAPPRREEKKRPPVRRSKQAPALGKAAAGVVIGILAAAMLLYWHDQGSVGEPYESASSFSESQTDGSGVPPGSATTINDASDASEPPQVEYVDGEVRNVHIPSSVDEGQSLTASARVRNTGTAGETFTVELSSSSASATESVYLSEGESEDVSLSITPGRDDWEVSLSLYADGELLDSQESPITVQYVDGEIVSVDIPSSVEEGEPVEVTITVKNTGNKGGYFEVEFGQQSETTYLTGGFSYDITFEAEFYRNDDSVNISLSYGGELLDASTESFSVLYPELTLSQRVWDWEWTEGDEGLPVPSVTVSYTVKNEGTGSAKNVSLKRDGSQFWHLAELEAGDEYKDNYTLTPSPHWEWIVDTSFITEYYPQSRLEAEYGEHVVTDTFTKTISRGGEFTRPSENYLRERRDFLKSLVTPNDSVVQDKLDDLLSGKDWYDLRSDEALLLDYVGDTSVEIGGFEIIGDSGIEYDHEKADDHDEWYSNHNFWRQLPRETIRRGKGVCIDQAILYASLLRAHGYSPEDVFIISGDLQVPGGGGRHAWVAIRGYMGNNGWNLVETTGGGLNRIANGTIGDSLRAVNDWIRTEILDQEDGQMYREFYRFNDKHFEKVSGNWSY